MKSASSASVRRPSARSAAGSRPRPPRPRGGSSGPTCRASDRGDRSRSALNAAPLGSERGCERRLGTSRRADRAPRRSPRAPRRARPGARAARARARSPRRPAPPPPRRALGGRPREAEHDAGRLAGVEPSRAAYGVAGELEQGARAGRSHPRRAGAPPGRADPTATRTTAASSSGGQLRAAAPRRTSGARAARAAGTARAGSASGSSPAAAELAATSTITA